MGEIVSIAEETVTLLGSQYRPNAKIWCEISNELFHAWRLAVAEYAECVRALQTSKGFEFESMHRRCEERRLSIKKTRLAYEAHCRMHGCWGSETLGSKGALAVRGSVLKNPPGPQPGCNPGF